MRMWEKPGGGLEMFDESARPQSHRFRYSGLHAGGHSSFCQSTHVVHGDRSKTGEWRKQRHTCTTAGVRCVTEDTETCVINAFWKGVEPDAQASCARPSTSLSGDSAASLCLIRARLLSPQRSCTHTKHKRPILDMCKCDVSQHRFLLVFMGELRVRVECVCVCACVTNEII